MAEGLFITLVITGIICLPVILYLPLGISDYFYKKMVKYFPHNTNSTVSISIFDYILSVTGLMLGLLVSVAYTYGKAKPLAIAAILAVAFLIKDNYNLYHDIFTRDGISFNGTVVKAYAQSAYSIGQRSIQILTHEYILEIDTDDGDFIKCASKLVDLLDGDRIENAYVTKRTNLLLYYDKR